MVTASVFQGEGSACTMTQCFERTLEHGWTLEEKGGASETGPGSVLGARLRKLDLAPTPGEAVESEMIRFAS